MSQYVFHIRHNSRPDSIQAFVDLVSEYPGSDDLELLEYGAAQGSSIGTSINSPQSLRENVAQCLRDFELLEPKQNRFTAKGVSFCDLIYAKPELLGEVMHFFFYSAWDASAPAENCFSWSYATTVRLLWSSIQMEINQQRLADDVSTLIKQRFPNAKVSFGERSIRGALHWLRPLSPPVLEERDNVKRFARRSFCPPELFLLAVDYVYRVKGVQHGSNLLLEPEIQEQICQVCVLDPEAFERVAGYATLQFPFLTQGMGGGWGSYLRLGRTPVLDDLR